jgi:hypothetical protein
MLSGRSTTPATRRLEANNIRTGQSAVNDKVTGRGGAAQLLRLKPTTFSSRTKSLGIRAKACLMESAFTIQCRSDRCSSAQA